MGGRGHARADALADEASKPCKKMDLEKPIAADEGSSGQQGGLDVLAAVLDLHSELVAPPLEQVTPLPRLLPPLPEPAVNDDGEEVLQSQQVAPLAPQPEQVAPLPQSVGPLPWVPPVPKHVVVGDDNEEDILSEDIDGDEEGQMIYRRRKGRVLVHGVHARCVRPRSGGYGCPFCNQKVKNTRISVIQHAFGRAASTTHDFAFRVSHAALAEYLSRVLGSACTLAARMEALLV